MAHFNICVLVKNDTNLELIDLAQEKAWPLLDKFMEGEASEDDVHYDAWELLDEVSRTDFDRMLFGQTDEYRPCGAIITPDGSWIEGRWMQAASPEETERNYQAWFARMAEVLEEHKDCTALLADCHF